MNEKHRWKPPHSTRSAPLGTPAIVGAVLPPGPSELGNRNLELPLNFALCTLNFELPASPFALRPSLSFGSRLAQTAGRLTLDA